jgi:deazaflavin-dependent oxidoreductase (nitroreductase family)
LAFDTALASEEYCYLTTTGRVTGNPRTIEIWFALHEGTFYMLAGGRQRSDWVRNLMRHAAVSIRIADHTFEATARVLSANTDEDALARRLLLEKYGRGRNDLADWGRTALPVAFETAD